MPYRTRPTNARGRGRAITERVCGPLSEIASSSGVCPSRRHVYLFPAAADYGLMQHRNGRLVGQLEQHWASRAAVDAISTYIEVSSALVTVASLSRRRRTGARTVDVVIVVTELWEWII